MNDFLVESVLRGVLGGRTRKRSKKALRYLTGRGKGAGSFVNASTLLTAAGVAWGIYETMQSSPSAGLPQAGAGVPPAGAGLKTGPKTEALPPQPNLGPGQR